MDEFNIVNYEGIKNKIYTIRGVQVMIDNDIAKLYGVETKRLNETVKRNKARFPIQFMFQMEKEEFENWKSQIATSNYYKMGLRKLPFCFTEHGVAMLSAVLSSKKAIDVSIQIMEAFINMRRNLHSNSLVLTRLNNLEKNNLVYETKFDEIFNLLENKKIEQTEGIFYSGEVFDAYNFISDLIRKAINSIILIDNYLDDTILILFAKRQMGVKVIIYTEKITDKLKLDLLKFNLQYETIEIKEINNFHDRFLIIDNDVYHFGASLKDLGKKIFAFSKMEKKNLDKINFQSGLSFFLF